MKTLIHILLGTLLFAGSCSDEMPVCTPAVHGPRHVTFTFSCDALPGTRAVADESRVEDINLYLYPANDAQARHVYAASQRTVALELPDGRYTLYAVANLGTDTGPLPEAEVRALRSAWNPDGSDSGTLPMSAMRTFTVRGTTQIAIELVRAVAKVDFSYTVAADFRNSLSVRSVRLCNVPRFAALFGEGRITADGECAATEAFPADGDGYSAVYYLPENLQGKNVLIPGQEQKNEANAPEYAAYILIEGEADGLHVVYRIYLGENNTSDFNIARNRVYRIEARILGRNTVDWRVSTTEVSVTPFTERHAPGRTATAQLRVVSTNNDRSTCFLTCEREEGDGDVTLDGEPILFGVPYPFLSGDGERIAEIAYTQQREGDVRLRLVLTDETGLHAERVLQTSYVREPLRVSFTQDKFELAALDRARVDFTIEQDDYDGTYTVQVEGTPTLFRNLTDDIGPVTGYTVAGNGTYPLRIRPEAVGENPYRITVTDEKGNSAFFDSFVTGIKTVSCFTCSFSKISGGIEVVAEGTYPVMNDLTITLNPTVTVVLRGGATKTLTCTMNVKIEADRMRGRASATLDLGTGYTDYFMTDYERLSPARHPRTEWSNTPYDNFQTDKKRHEKTTNIHYGGFAAGGFVGSAPQGCGADLRREGQRPCGMQRDAERRGRNGPDGQLVAGAVRLLESGEYRIPLDELPRRTARRPLLVLRILRRALSRAAPHLCRLRPRKPDKTL